jgi:hypothetical protein
MQSVVDRDGPRVEVNVAADIAALRVRKIMSQMVADESGGPGRRLRAARAQSSVPARR